MKKLSYLLIPLLISAILTATLLAQDGSDCPIPADAPDAFAFYLGQGDAHSVNAQYDRALADYTCAIALRPDYAPAYARRGYAYAILNDNASALADYENALNYDELLLEAYLNRGALYTQLGNFGLAISDFTLVINLAPDNTTALNNRAVIHAIEGNYDLALADLERALTLEPQNPTLYATRAAVYSALAARDYQQFIANSPEGELARLPAGTPSKVISAIDESLRSGNYSFWLALLKQRQ